MPMLEEKRVFLALNLPEEIKTEIDFLLHKLRKNVDYVKWVDASGLHITLHFLGDLTIDVINKLIKNLENLEGRYKGEMEFKLGELNAFPNIYNSRIIFLETKQQSGTNVLKLHKETLDEIMKLNLEVDLRKWSPHITLGRVKSKINSQIFSQYDIKEKIIFKISGFELMESELKPTGAEYKVIKSFKF
jgi:RNA 2',3'-cyclic 3'-phosphodiesterase